MVCRGCNNASETKSTHGGSAVRLSLTPVFLIFGAMFVQQSDAQRGSLDSRRDQLKRLLNDEWEYTLRTVPELATNVGDDRYNDRLSDFSDKAIAENLEHSIKPSHTCAMASAII